MVIKCILNIHNKGMCNVSTKHNKDANPSSPLTLVNAHVHRTYTSKILGQHSTYYVKICVNAKEGMQIYLHMCTRGEAYLLWKERFFTFLFTCISYYY